MVDKATKILLDSSCCFDFGSVKDVGFLEVLALLLLKDNHICT